MNLKLSKAEYLELKKILISEEIDNLENIDKNILSGLRQRLIDDNPIKLYVDGAANLHSKIAGIGGVFYRNGQELYSFSEFIGNATNNEAEYKSLINGLKESLSLKLLNIEIYADSELVVKQINGEYKVKNDRMIKLNNEARRLLEKFEFWSISHIPREKNMVADKLSKAGMANAK